VAGGQFVIAPTLAVRFTRKSIEHNAGRVSLAHAGNVRPVELRRPIGEQADLLFEAPDGKIAQP
jgi:hypothetical protein